METSTYELSQKWHPDTDDSTDTYYSIRHQYWSVYGHWHAQLTAPTIVRRLSKIPYSGHDYKIKWNADYNTNAGAHSTDRGTYSGSNRTASAQFDNTSGDFNGSQNAADGWVREGGTIDLGWPNHTFESSKLPKVQWIFIEEGDTSTTYTAVENTSYPSFADAPMEYSTGFDDMSWVDSNFVWPNGGSNVNITVPYDTTSHTFYIDVPFHWKNRHYMYWSAGLEVADEYGDINQWEITTNSTTDSGANRFVGAGDWDGFDWGETGISSWFPSITVNNAGTWGTLLQQTQALKARYLEENTTYNCVITWNSSFTQNITLKVDSQYTIDDTSWTTSSSQSYPNFDPNPALALGQSFTNLTGTTSGGDRWKHVYKTAAQVGDQHGVLAFSSSDVNKYLRKAADDTTHTLFGGGVSCIIEGFNCWQYRYGGQWHHHQAGEYIWWMGSSAKSDDVTTPHASRGFGVAMRTGADMWYTTTGNPFVAVNTGIGRGGLRGYASNDHNMTWADGWTEDFSQENHYIPYKGSTRIDIKVDTFFCNEGYNGDNNRMRFSASVYWRYHNPGSSTDTDIAWTPCIKPADTTQHIVNFSTGGMWWNHRTDGDERRGHSYKANELFRSDTTSYANGLWVGGVPNEPGWTGIGRQSSYSLSNRCGASGYRIAIINTSTNTTSSAHDGGLAVSGWTG